MKESWPYGRQHKARSEKDSSESEVLQFPNRDVPSSWKVQSKEKTGLNGV